MRISKLVSFLTALAISASAFVTLPAAVSAADEDVLLTVADEGDVTEPGEGETPAEPAETETPTPVPEIVPLDVKPLPMGTTISFDDYLTETGSDGKLVKKTIEGSMVVLDYVAVYAGLEADKEQIDIDGSNKTINGEKYKTRLKFGGLVMYDENGAPARRVISVTPAEAGRLKVAFAHASGKGDPRTIGAYQNGKPIGEQNIEAKSDPDIFSVDVEAGTPVYIYSKVGGVNIHLISLTDGSAVETEAPEVTEAPPVEISKLPVNNTVKFDVIASYEEINQYGDYVAIYADAGKKIETATSNKTVNGTKYASCLKLGGAGSVKNGTPNRAIGIIPASAGTLVIDFVHASSSATDERALEAYQNGNVTTSDPVQPGAEGKLEVTVAADELVYIYSAKSGLNIYGITLIDGDAPTQPTESTDPTDPTNPPKEDSTSKPAEPLTPLTVTALPKDTAVNFASYVTKNEETGKYEGTTSITEPTVVSAYVAVYANADNKIDIDPSSKTIDGTNQGTKYVARLKFGGNAAYDASGAPAMRVISVTPAVEGTLYVDFAHASSAEKTDEIRTIAAYQNGAEIGTKDIAPDGIDTFKVNVAAGEPVYLYSKVSALNIYGIILKDAEELPTPETCVKITATYNDDNTLLDVKIDEVDKSIATPGAVREGNTLVTYWESLDSMKPVTANAETPTEPAPTPDNGLTGDVVWTSLTETRELKANDELIPGLIVLFDNVSENNKYIRGAANGDVTASTENSSTLKYTAAADGKLSVEIYELGATKEAVITDLETTNSVITYKNGTEEKQTIILSAEVEAGKSYSITVKGSKGQFSAAAFTAQAISKTWTWGASDASIGIPAGTELLPGLTTLFDNTATSNKYITHNETNGKLTDDGAEGTALKYEATAAGTLTVTIIDLGTVAKPANPVIYNHTTGETVYTYTTSDDKETVVLTAEVEAGNVYYITALGGTKARFSAASFTTAK